MHIDLDNSCTLCSVLSTSISTLLRCAFGDFDYDSVVDANRILGPVFFFMWLLYAAVILLNMAIAIISESFVKVICGARIIVLGSVWEHEFAFASCVPIVLFLLHNCCFQRDFFQILEQDEETAGETTIFDYMKGVMTLSL